MVDVKQLAAVVSFALGYLCRTSGIVRLKIAGHEERSNRSGAQA